MPAPNFAIHLNYWDFQNPEMVTMVQERGRGSNQKGVSLQRGGPGNGDHLPLDDAANLEETDRVFTTVTVQPEFDGKFKLFQKPRSSGLDKAGRGKRKTHAETGMGFWWCAEHVRQLGGEFSLICTPLHVKIGPAGYWPGIDKNLLWVK
jgi:hypothetical protein